MDFKVNKKGFYKFVKRMFQDTAEIKKGYPVLIPIMHKHQIYINGLCIFLDKSSENREYFFSVNSYGQLSIVKREHGQESNHIIFSLENLKSIEFLTKNVYGPINPKTNDYYNDMYRFSF